MLTFIQTTKGITTIINGKVRVVATGEPHYEEVLNAIKAGSDEAVILEILQKEQRRLEAAAAALAERKLSDNVVVRAGQVYFRDAVVHNTLTERMLKQLDEGFDLSPMAAFLANLMENPSYRAVRDLYSFLEYGQMPITPDGCFLAYKAIRPDWKDIRSGTFDNSIGCVVSMPRNLVDENPEETCSHGLHVCAFEYLPNFSHADGHVVVCKINPRDVVAIPKDYNNTKMRVCRYEVIAEYENYYVEHPECRLSQISVATDEDEPFHLEIEGDSPDTESYSTLSEAARRAEELLSYDSTSRVTITNVVTGVEVFNDSNADYVPEDEEDEDEDADEATFSVKVYGSERGLADGDYTLFDCCLSLEDARSRSFVAQEECAPFAVHIENESTGEVVAKLS